MTRADRQHMHNAINTLSHAEVAQIVKQYHPKLSGKTLDIAAKAAIAAAHAIVSPKRKESAN